MQVLSLCVLFIIAININAANCLSTYLPGVTLGDFFYDVNATDFANSMVLWNAQGDNFSLITGYNVNSYSSQTNLFERITTNVVFPWNYVDEPILNISHFSYGPQRAYTLISTCTLPSTITDYEDTIAFFFQNNTYMFFRKFLYKVDMSQSNCKLSKVLHLKYKNQYRVSFSVDHVSYSSGNKLIDLWYKDGNFKAVTHEISGPPTVCLESYPYFTEDFKTGNLYLVCQPNGRINNTFWEGIRDQSNSKGEISWVQLKNIPSTQNAFFTIDNRYNSTLLCNSDYSLQVAYCTDIISGERVWQGSSLKNYCNPKCSSSFFMYDPYCN